MMNMGNEQILNTFKPAKEIIKDIKDTVQTYTNVMSFGDRKKFRDIDSKDIRDFAVPKQEEINVILKAALDIVEDESEKETIQQCIELNKTIKDHLNQLVKKDFNMDQINTEVKSLSGSIYRLVKSYE